jgi:hypothetical protein
MFEGFTKWYVNPLHMHGPVGSMWVQILFYSTLIFLLPFFLFIGKFSSIFLSLSKGNCNDRDKLWFLKAFLLVVLLMHFFVLMVLYMVDYDCDIKN